MKSIKTFLPLGEAVQDVICVFHNMEYMECKWGRNPKILASSQLNLYFWYVICPAKYMLFT